MAAEGSYANMWNQQLKGMEKDGAGADSSSETPDEGKSGKEKSN